MTTTRARADRYLASLRRWSAELRRIAQEWDSPDFDERERLAFPLEWDNILDRLTAVEAMARDGRLSVSTLAELREVACELDSLRPTMERLGLRMPDPDALTRAIAAPVA